MENAEDRNILAQFDTLEKKIERLIEICAIQEEKRLELERRNEKLEEDLRERIEAEQRYSEERSLVRSKIDGLMMKIDEGFDSDRSD